MESLYITVRSLEMTVGLDGGDTCGKFREISGASRGGSVPVCVILYEAYLVIGMCVKRLDIRSF